MTGERRQEETPLVPLIVIRVEAPTASLDEFVSQYCRYFGSEVMFLPTEGFQPPGRRVRFAFALSDGNEIVWGEGVVMRMRRDSGNPSRPPGMELRYQLLDEASQAVVDRMLQLRLSGAQMGRPEPPPYVSMWLEHERDEVEARTRPRVPQLTASAEELEKQLVSHRPLPAQPLPANPFADVTREALEYFVDWALARMTGPPRRRPITQEIAVLAEKPPALGIASFVAGVALTIAVLGVVKLATGKQVAPPSAPGAQRIATPRESAHEHVGAVATADGLKQRALPPARSSPPPPPHVPLPHPPPPSLAHAPPPPPAHAHKDKPVLLSLHATPADAWLSVDGEPPAQGPLRLQVAPGPHELVVERQRYASAHLHVQAPGHLSVHLSRPPATLRVTSSPPGAGVRLDGQPVGMTPLEVTVTAYEQHRVDVELDGESQRRRVYVKPPFAVVDVPLNRSGQRDTRNARYPRASVHPASL